MTQKSPHIYLIFFGERFWELYAVYLSVTIASSNKISGNIITKTARWPTKLDMGSLERDVERDEYAECAEKGRRS